VQVRYANVVGILNRKATHETLSHFRSQISVEVFDSRIAPSFSKRIIPRIIKRISMRRTVVFKTVFEQHACACIRQIVVADVQTGDSRSNRLGYHLEVTVLQAQPPKLQDSETRQEPEFA
jgi:hypothetical protein